MFHNWWKNGSRNIPWSKQTMSDFLLSISIPTEIIECLTLAEMAECYCLLNVMSFLSKKIKPGQEGLLPK